MYLKKLQLVGFKSFAQKTALDFAVNEDADKRHFDITVIVGPNGSGKSNVVDGMRWVLGEQGMKNLRGKKSEDVIFAGSDRKTKLGSAQVSLLFDNSDKKVPVDFKEIEISRKLYRSGESEYILNGSKVRLIDLQDMLAKAGIGQNSYTIINQGMVDAVLNATPVERRALLETAAGVKPFQLKKDRSIRKLDSSKRNLKQVEVLVQEIEPHLKMLKRQADRAQKGKEVFEKLKEKQLKLYSFLWSRFHSEQGETLEKKEELGREMMKIQRLVDKLSDEVSTQSKEEGMSSNKQFELENKREKLRQEISKFERDLIMTEGRIELEKEKEKNFEMIESIPVDLNYVKEKLSELKRQQEELVKRLAAIESVNQVQEVKEFARAITQELHEIYSDVIKGRAEKKADNKHEKERIVNLKAVSELKKKKEALEKEISQMREKLDALSKQIQAEIEEDRKRRKHFFEQEHELRVKQTELDQLKDKFNDSKIALARHEVKEEDLINAVTRELKMEIKDLPKYEGEGFDTYSLEQEIGRLKNQLEQIGGIDPIVVKEYEETRQRFDFLTKESEDLEKAIEQLREIVKEMDAKIEQSFKKTFAKVNDEFSKYFRIMFDGGKASLVKKDVVSRSAKSKKDLDEEAGENQEQDDDQETKTEIGIDIQAVPPGKKITNLSLLSGGERTLTSIALMFAIIAYNPPPFAILDEVEAALDESNSKRFGKIIRDLSKDTQFILITHNRETMRQASLLYGVTMGEDGVSRLLSVRLDQVGAKGEIKN